jgi:hypothetical protein
VATTWLSGTVGLVNHIRIELCYIPYPDVCSGIVRVGLHHQTENAETQEPEADQSIEEVNFMDFINKKTAESLTFPLFLFRS